MKKWWLGILTLIYSLSLTITTFKLNNVNNQLIQNSVKNKTRSSQTNESQKTEDQDFYEEKMIDSWIELTSFENYISKFVPQTDLIKVKKQSEKTIDLNKFGFENDGKKVGYIEMTMVIKWANIILWNHESEIPDYIVHIKIDLNKSSTQSFFKEEKAGGATNGAEFWSQVDISFVKEENQIQIKTDQWTGLNHRVAYNTFITKTKLMTSFENVKLNFKYAEDSGHYYLKNLDPGIIKVDFSPWSNWDSNNQSIIYELNKIQFVKNNSVFHIENNFKISDIPLQDIYKAVEKYDPSFNFKIKITAPENNEWIGSKNLTISLIIDYEIYPKKELYYEILNDKNSKFKPDLKKEIDLNLLEKENPLIPKENPFIVLNELKIENLEMKFQKEMKEVDFDPLINEILNKGNDLNLEMLVDYEISFINPLSEFDKKDFVELLLKGISPKVKGKKQIKISNKVKRQKDKGGENDINWIIISIAGIILFTMILAMIYTVLLKKKKKTTDNNQIGTIE